MQGPLSFHGNENIGDDLVNDQATHLDLDRQSSGDSLKDSIAKFMHSSKSKQVQKVDGVIPQHSEQAQASQCSDSVMLSEETV